VRRGLRPTLLGFTALAPEWQLASRSGSRRSEPFRPLSLRSGRIPKLPYPPLRFFQPSAPCKSTLQVLCPELSSRHFLAWCIELKIDAIQTQRETDINVFVENSHGRLRDKCLNVI